MSEVKTVNAIVTKAVIEALENGKLPWLGKRNRYNLNVLSKRPYRGVNILLTQHKGYESPLWLSKKQVTDFKFQLKAGEDEKPTRIVFSIYRRKPDETGSYFFYTTFQVYNLDQMEVINEKMVNRLYKNITPVDLEVLKLATPARLLKYITDSDKVPKIEAGPKTIYSEGANAIKMAPPQSYEIESEWYLDAFRAIAQSTNKKNKVPRKLDITSEKLACEMAAAFLCAECDISIDPQTIAYLANDWKEKINKKSGMMIIKAAREATKIAEYILGTHSVEADNDFKKLLATEAVKMLAA